MARLPASKSDSRAAAGEPFCGNCGYSFKGLNDIGRCPECGKPIVEVLMRPGFAPRGRRYRSKATFFGWPVIDIALGPGQDGSMGKARGLIAVGDLALGGIAIGGLARGIVSIGGLALGIFSFGGLSAGLFTAIGGCAISMGIADGGVAVGAIASGGLAFGYFAEGGLAFGHAVRDAMHHGRLVARQFRAVDWLLGPFPPTLISRSISYFVEAAPAPLATLIMGLIALVQIQRRGDGG